ncbi:MAG TPA: hypothetical protein PLO90_04435 [Clostridia bacterium]|jgi:hypothetical protein|nr:hypothetical protein [Clostridia bacterium]
MKPLFQIACISALICYNQIYRNTLFDGKEGMIQGGETHTAGG